MYQINLTIKTISGSILYQDIQHYNEYESMKKLLSKFNSFFRRGKKFLINYEVAFESQSNKALFEEKNDLKEAETILFEVALSENEKQLKKYSSTYEPNSGRLKCKYHIKDRFQI